MRARKLSVLQFTELRSSSELQLVLEIQHSVHRAKHVVAQRFQRLAQCCVQIRTSIAACHLQGDVFNQESVMTTHLPSIAVSGAG